MKILKRSILSADEVEKELPFLQMDGEMTV